MNRVLTGENNINIEPPGSLKTRILKDGTASGPLWGGNMSLLINRLGTSDAHEYCLEGPRDRKSVV